jgi:hypothetical protein
MRNLEEGQTSASKRHGLQVPTGTSPKVSGAGYVSVGSTSRWQGGHDLSGCPR